MDLLPPIYRETAANGHFGRDEPEFPWELTDKAEIFRASAGLWDEGDLGDRACGDGARSTRSDRIRGIA